MAKSVVAATVAWVIGNIALGASVPAFAPFTAVMMVQASVYRSLRQALQYVLAVIAGVCIEGGLGFALGPNIGTFVLLTFIAVLIGRWHRLENQGVQVATAAFFAYSIFIGVTSTDQRLRDLADILLLVAVGAACGVLTDYLYPPLRHRTAANSIGRLATVMGDLLSEMSRTLANGPPDASTAEDWLHRARRFDDTVVQARDAVIHAAESIRWNPRRLRRAHPSSVRGYRAMVESLGRAGEQVRSIAKTLTYLEQQHREEGDGARQTFLSSYAELLDAASASAYDIGYVDGLSSSEDAGSFSEHIRRGREQYETVTRQVTEARMQTPDGWPLYGELLLDGDRLIEEFEASRQRLKEAL